MLHCISLITKRWMRRGASAARAIATAIRSARRPGTVLTNLSRVSDVSSHRVQLFLSLRGEERLG